MGLGLMPYIEQSRRPIIYDKFNGSSGGGLEPPEPTTAFIAVHEIQTPGELNYAITEMCLNYAEEFDHRYATYNAIIGALECAKLEFYRRLTAPYEDEKIADNGDVYS
jgi:hypothetical protein